MPVDKQLLEDCIVEAAGDDAELATALRTKLAANESLAAKFVAGRMRNSVAAARTRRALDLTQEGVDAPEHLLLEALEERVRVALGALRLRAHEDARDSR